MKTAIDNIIMWLNWCIDVKMLSSLRSDGFSGLQFQQEQLNRLTLLVEMRKKSKKDGKWREKSRDNPDDNEQLL